VRAQIAEPSASADERKVPAVNGNAADSQTDGLPKGPSSSPGPAPNGPGESHPPPRPSLARTLNGDESKKANVANGKKEGRRSSWISSLSSKFSSSTLPLPPRNAGVESQPALTASPQSSPKLELNNPLDKKGSTKEPKKEGKKDDTKPATFVYTPPRRQSVLVAAGKETKLEHPGFLSALRRLSSANNAAMARAAGTGGLCPRKVLNIDQNRERIKIPEFDQNKLKRVAFCVDVEIAGYSSQADEVAEQPGRPALSAAQKQGPLAVVAAAAEKPSGAKKDVRDAKYKGKGEGAALKNARAAMTEHEDTGETTITDAAKVSEPPKDTELAGSEATDANDEKEPAPQTRKKEKKKRSEAERKERREKKRRHAEENGLVPLELTREHDDSDSSPSSTPPGASTPRKHGDQPTTDPLRIYKRCCQLRETTALAQVKEQISNPSATLAEAPGTVAVLDLSGLQIALQDIVTLGDWLAVVPVRKLILNDCFLTDEAVRVILSGLASCKSVEQTRQNRKLPKRRSGKRGHEQMGVIEKLCLKNNDSITHIGWKHIALFMHMSRSLRAIDLSGIPFPQGPGDLSRTSTSSSGSNSTSADTAHKNADLGALIVRAISERLGDDLEELILGGCGLSTANVRDIVDCAIKRKIRRLGLADNSLSEEALSHVLRYVKSGACEGLDLGGNNLHGSGHLVGGDAYDDDCRLFALSLSDCSLTPQDLSTILTPLVKLRHLKFIDLSRNPDLFSGTRNAVPLLRKLLPKMQALKRIHLSDVGLTPDHVIALAEILPDCPEIAHVSILENESLIHAMNSKESESQEEACAFLASLMTAVRVSHTIIAIEIEVPSADSSEVVKALASQVVAYSLRNMEHSALGEVGVKSADLPQKDAPEVLLHLVGHMEGYLENHDNDEPAPDEDYMIASTGIVKALGVCLETKDGSSTTQSANISPTASGPATPRQGPIGHRVHSKPKNVSLELCESARKIRMRLRPALIKEDRAGNHTNYRKSCQPSGGFPFVNRRVFSGRLLSLDQTLQRMIRRFEDEYPETKVPSAPPSPPLTANSMVSPNPSLGDTSLLSASIDLPRIGSPDGYFSVDSGHVDDDHSLKLSRSPSTTSLAARAFTEQEGRMLRFGQTLRRELLKPTDDVQGTSQNDAPEPPHLASLRARLEEFRGEEIRHKVEEEGVDNVVRQLGLNARELLTLKEEDPAGFEDFRNSQLAAQINAGMLGARSANKVES